MNLNKREFKINEFEKKILFLLTTSKVYIKIKVIKICRTSRNISYSPHSSNLEIRSFLEIKEIDKVY